jgi:DNA-binding NtrC family response regulator
MPASPRAQRSENTGDQPGARRAICHACHGRRAVGLRIEKRAARCEDLGAPGWLATILVVDDEPVVHEAVRVVLHSHGYDVATAGSGAEALTRLARQQFDVIVSDIRMPGLGGFELDDLRLSVQRVLRLRDADASGRPPRPRTARPAGPPLVGESPALVTLRADIERCAPTPSNVLITGESGVGKELVAAAISETLIESQLLGHVRGAFTSALQANPGLFVAAHRGTLFLDEIGELPFPLQVKLLRVIEDRQVWPVGGTKGLPVDVRIIASTNRDLPREVEAGSFREDLTCTCPRSANGAATSHSWSIT